MTRIKRPRSIRGALLAVLLPAGIGLMALAWVIHGLLLDRMSREFVENRLQDEVTFLEHQIRNVNGAIDALRTGDYFEEVFHHAFAIQTPTQTLISPTSWQPVLTPLLQSRQQGAIRLSPDGEPVDLLAFRRTFQLNGAAITVLVAEDMAALKDSQSALHTWTAIVSIALILLLAIIIWLGITLSMRPVSQLQAELKLLQAGQRSRIDGSAPQEFRPLVLQLNQLLDSLDQRLTRSREALANLSHSLKTPIAAVRQLLEDTDRPLDTDLRREMAFKLGELDRQLESEMRRSRFAGPQVGKSALPVKQSRDLLWMMGRLYPDKRFELSTTLGDDDRWQIEEQDLNELIGNLLDNGGKWAQTGVELTLARHHGSLLITVADDGPGVSVGALDSLGTRGLRLDEQTPGHGLGLAIVNDIVARYAGEVTFSLAPGGGLMAAIQLPGTP